MLNGEILTITKNGKFASYYPNGALMKLYDCKDGKLHGKYELFCVDGVLIERSNYKNGKRHGECYVMINLSEVLYYHYEGENITEEVLELVAQLEETEVLDEKNAIRGLAKLNWGIDI